MNPVELFAVFFICLTVVCIAGLICATMVSLKTGPEPEETPEEKTPEEIEEPRHSE